jgi:hypothetical protein
MCLIDRNVGSYAKKWFIYLLGVIFRKMNRLFSLSLAFCECLSVCMHGKLSYGMLPRICSCASAVFAIVKWNGHAHTSVYSYDFIGELR